MHHINWFFIRLPNFYTQWSIFVFLGDYAPNHRQFGLFYFTTATTTNKVRTTECINTVI